MSSGDVELDTRLLDKLIRSLKAAPPMAKVGVLGAKNARKGDETTNAGIGLKHEFGDEDVPQRSFLRVPLAENLKSAAEKSGAFSDKALKEVMQVGTLLPWVKKLGVIGVGVVLEAFNSGGYGKWPSSNMKYKNNHQTLVETQQLRDSITSEVGQ